MTIKKLCVQLGLHRWYNFWWPFNCYVLLPCLGMNFCCWSNYYFLEFYFDVKLVRRVIHTHCINTLDKFFSVFKENWKKDLDFHASSMTLLNVKMALVFGNRVWVWGEIKKRWRVVMSETHKDHETKWVMKLFDKLSLDDAIKRKKFGWMSFSWCRFRQERDVSIPSIAQMDIISF